MSLINEALKKAQKQRSHDVVAPSTVATGPLPPRVPKRAEPMPAQRLVLAGMVCVIFLLAAAGGAWFLFTDPNPAPAPAPTPRIAKAPDAAAAASAATATTPGTAVVPGSATANTPSGPAAAPTSAPGTGAPVTASTPAAAAVPPTAVPSTAAATPLPAPGPAPTVAAAPPPAPEPTLRPEPTVPGDILRIDLTSARPLTPPDPKVAAAVDLMKVSGIRASGSDPKVLMNDRVFRRNDLVDRTLGLRLHDIAADRLVFVDEAGATYVKNF
jgi:hypothetical protein